MIRLLEKLIVQRDEIHKEYGRSLRYTQDYQKRLSIIRKVLVQEKELFEGRKVNDRIVSIDNTEVAQKTDLGTLMQEHSAGDALSITVARDGQMQTVSLTLGEKNASNSGNGTNGASRQENSAESAPQQNPQG